MLPGRHQGSLIPSPSVRALQLPQKSDPQVASTRSAREARSNPSYSYIAPLAVFVLARQYLHFCISQPKEDHLPGRHTPTRSMQTEGELCNAYRLPGAFLVKNDTPHHQHGPTRPISGTSKEARTVSNTNEPRRTHRAGRILSSDLEATYLILGIQGLLQQ